MSWNQLSVFRKREAMICTTIVFVVAAGTDDSCGRCATSQIGVASKNGGATKEDMDVCGAGPSRARDGA
jgi:hypothetical protein